MQIAESKAAPGRGRKVRLQKAPINHAAAHRTGQPLTAARKQTKIIMAPRFGIDEENLATRREFIRLNEDDRQVLLGLAEWSSQQAASMSKDFYDWQFNFGPTRTFFENFARSR